MGIGDLPEELFTSAVDLWHEAGLTRPWNDPEADLRRAMDGATSRVLAARAPDGGLAGTAMVGHDRHRGWVYYLAVRPQQRGTGLGRQLMRTCEDWLRERGVPKIQLMVRHGNEGTAAFYAALGYVDSGVVVLGRRLDG